jgi:hypothetical protein
MKPNSYYLAEQTRVQITLDLSMNELADLLVGEIVGLEDRHAMSSRLSVRLEQIYQSGKTALLAEQAEEARVRTEERSAALEAVGLGSGLGSIRK